MEALISVTVAALAVIDMAKGVDRSALAPGPGPGRLPPGHAHKDSDLRNTRRTQRLDPALVCGPVFPNSLPCVRHKGDRSKGGPTEKERLDSGGFAGRTADHCPHPFEGRG